MHYANQTQTQVLLLCVAVFRKSHSHYYNPLSTVPSFTADFNSNVLPTQTLVRPTELQISRFCWLLFRIYGHNQDRPTFNRLEAGRLRGCALDFPAHSTITSGCTGVCRLGSRYVEISRLQHWRFACREGHMIMNLRPDLLCSTVFHFLFNFFFLFWVVR